MTTTCNVHIVNIHATGVNKTLPLYRVHWLHCLSKVCPQQLNSKHGEHFKIFVLVFLCFVFRNFTGLYVSQGKAPDEVFTFLKEVII